MTTNLSACISGAFGGLFAYAIELMGDRRGLAAWRWLFIVEFCITMVVGGISLIFLPSSAETAWFLTEEEKEIMRLKKRRDMIHRGDENSIASGSKLLSPIPLSIFSASRSLHLLLQSMDSAFSCLPFSLVSGKYMPGLSMNCWES